MSFINGYDRIGDLGRTVFDITHGRHLSAMGTEERKGYKRNQVKLLKSNNHEGCIEVYFKNGEWYKYFPNGTWA